jgi:hypothetical protein
MKLSHLASMVVIGSLLAGAGWAVPQPESRERFVCTFGASNRYVDIYRLASRGPRGAGCRVDYTRIASRKPWGWSPSCLKDISLAGLKPSGNPRSAVRILDFPT